MSRITQAVVRVANVLVDKLERTAGFVNHCWKRNPSWGYELILQLANAHEGEDRVLAERFLNEAEVAGWLLIKRHRYSAVPEKLALVCSDEAILYESLYSLTNRRSPRDRRTELAQIFTEYAGLKTTRCETEHNRHSIYGELWVNFCQRYADQLTTLDESKLLCRGLKLVQLEELLNDVFQLLHADQASHLREASTLYLGDSKKLETNQTVYLKWLAEITGGRITSFDDLGIQDKHRTITLWGNWTLKFDSKENKLCELGNFELPLRISQRDISTATLRHPDIPVITVENKESLESWALAKPNALLISSGELGGFSHSAVIDFIKSLPSSLRLFHWGDTDPAGFSILASLRERSGRMIESIGMEYVAEISNNSVNPETLSNLERQEITRLLESRFITESERNSLSEMLEADSKGSFEQEGRSIPQLPNS